jgi:hypothetical protein
MKIKIAFVFSRMFCASLVAVLCLIAGTSAASAWSGPTATPPSGNTEPPFNVGSSGQSKIGGLILNTLNSTYGLRVSAGFVGFRKLAPTNPFEVWVSNSGSAPVFSILSNGNTGVGTGNPASKLSVAGGMQIGDDSGSCVSAKAGTLRWHDAAIQICDGSAWTSL